MSGTFDLYEHASDGLGGDKLLLKNGNVKFATDWSRDGRFLLYYEIHPKSKRDLWLLPMGQQAERTPVAVLQSESNEANGRFSPNGRWIAYNSSSTGIDEVYVRTSPGSSGESGEWLVSQGGGALPVWSADGKELYFRDPDDYLMAVSVTGAGAAFQHTPAKRVFKLSILARNFDVDRDGKKFVVALPEDVSRQTPFGVVLHWTSLLKK